MEIPEARMSKYTELRTDIAVLGSGGAGLLAVLHAKKANPDAYAA